jgi:hypothetical protein
VVIAEERGIACVHLQHGRRRSRPRRVAERDGERRADDEDDEEA